MKTVNFTNKNLMSWLAMAMLCMFAVGANAQVCSQGANITLPGAPDCSVIIPATDLAGTGAGEFVKVVLIEAGEHVLPGDEELATYPNGRGSVRVTTPGTYKYEVTGGCWGTFNVEDKTGPVCIVDGLDLEVASCLDDEAHIESLFDVLDADDFDDCSSLRDEDVYSRTEKYSICSEQDIRDLPDHIRTNLDGWEFWHGTNRPWSPNDFNLCEVRVRYWKAADWDGNVSAEDCFQIVAIVRPVTVFINMVNVVECGTTPQEGPYFYEYDVNTQGPSSTPTYLEDGVKKCKFLATSHEDDKVYTCTDKCPDNTNTWKQARHWTVTDWCTANKVPIYIRMGDGQLRLDPADEVTVITTVEDTQAPTFSGSPAVTQWGNPYDCNVEVKIGSFTAYDACSGTLDAALEVEVRTADEHGNAYGGSFVKYEAGHGGTISFTAEKGATYEIYASAWDCCGNNTREMVGSGTVYVEDEFAPICVANDELEVSMIKTDHDGEHTLGARVYPIDIDEDSKDNCGIAGMYIRKAKQHEPGVDPLKDDEGWEDYVTYEYTTDEFDALSGDKCEAEMWVDLLVVDNYGNYSICSSRIILRDNNPVVITDVDDHIAYSCLDHAPEFGDIEVWGACYDKTMEDDGYEFHCPVSMGEAADKAIELTVELVKSLSGKDISDAYALSLLSNRSFPSSLLWFNSVDVKVFMVKKKTEHGFSHDFAAIARFEYNVTDEHFVFPQDYKVECSSEGIPAAASLSDIVTNDGCGEWVMHVTEKTFLGAEDACYKIIRNYEFINWCRWDENQEVRTQINKDPFDENGDGKILGDEYVKVGVEGLHGQGLNGYGGPYNERLVARGYFNYTQVIKVTDTEAPTGSIATDEGCDITTPGCDQGYVIFDVTVDDSCSKASFTYEITQGDASKFERDGNRIKGTGLSVGTYSIKVYVEDECGNFEWLEASETVTLSDCKKPTPIAYATFTAVMENCEVDVWLSDIYASSDDNCEVEDLAIELVYDNNGNGVIDAGDLDDSPLALASTDYSNYDVVTVKTVGEGVVALWARDASGNTQFAMAPIVAIDNSGQCGAGEFSEVAGRIVNENDENIDQVVISAKGSDMVDFTSIFDGSFNLTALPMNSDVTITAKKNVGHLNGVSTADLVLLQRHVLGVAPLTSAYKMIAADANNDERIDTRDMLHISRLILGIYTELPNNSSWRFIDKAYVFANPTSPWGFPEAIDFESLDNDAQADFIGVKIGDLSGNARPTQLLGSDDFKVGTMNIAIEDAKIAAGETRTIEFTTADFNDFAGYQFSIALDSRVQFNGIEAGNLEGLTEANFGLASLDNGVITTNWANAEGVSVDNGTVMFSLTVTASEDVNVSEILAVNSSVTPAEAYNSNLDVHNVSVKFNRAANGAFELFQNTPNPVSGETVIGFNLPKAGNAVLKVMDVAGRTIKSISGTYAAGYNNIILNKSELNATGVLYYQLDTEDNSATKKMVILE